MMTAPTLHAINTIVLPTPHLWQDLCQLFPSDYDFFRSSPTDWLHRGLRSVIVDKLTLAQNADHEQLWQRLRADTIDTVCRDDHDYPPLLLQISDPPPILYRRGSWPQGSRYLAIVGSRHMTTYGSHCLKKIVPPLVAQGVVVVSGLALGIDSYAQHQALTHNGYTIAVLGGGIDDASITPQSHVHLAHEIIRNGSCLISEIPPGVQPQKYHFPQRNRIISGLSHGTLVVEAASTSGSLITAKQALEQNRDVFAIPGDVHRPTSAGCHNLLRDGAIITTSANDICEAWQLALQSRATTWHPRTIEEQIICKLLAHESLSVDKIVSMSKLTTSLVTSLLTQLELHGIVRHNEHHWYSLCAYVQTTGDCGVTH